MDNVYEIQKHWNKINTIKGECSLTDKDFILTEKDFYPPADNRMLQSFIEDIDEENNYLEYAAYIYDLYEEENYYEN